MELPAPYLQLVAVEMAAAQQIASLVLVVVRHLAVAVNTMSLLNKPPPVGEVVPTQQDGTLATDHMATIAVAFAMETAVMGVSLVVPVVFQRIAPV